MPELIVAIYHTIQDTDAIRRAIQEIGTAADDISISDYVDPVAANAPASIEKPGGWFYFLSGIPKVDVEAYRRAVARGRTIVAVRADDEDIDRTLDVLARFDPVELGEVEAVAGERVAGAQAGARGAAERLRRYRTEGGDGR